MIPRSAVRMEHGEDEQAKLAHAREKGIEQGKMQLIRGMHKNGMPLEDIAKFTGLKVADIQQFLQG